MMFDFDMNSSFNPDFEKFMKQVMEDLRLHQQMEGIKENVNWGVHNLMMDVGDLAFRKDPAISEEKNLEASHYATDVVMNQYKPIWFEYFTVLWFRQEFDLLSNGAFLSACGAYITREAGHTLDSWFAAYYSYNGQHVEAISAEKVLTELIENPEFTKQIDALQILANARK